MAVQMYMIRIKCLLKDRANIFWTFLFPIILSTFFSMAFSNLYTSETFQSIKIGVVKNESYDNNEEFKSALKEASMSKDKDGSKLFHMTESSEEEAIKLLDENKIDGYIKMDDKIQFFVKTSGLNQTITKSFLESFEENINTVTTLASNNPGQLENIIDDLSDSSNYTEANSSSNPPDMTLNYYYALLAMACLYGANWGNKEITEIEADLSMKGARINISPMHKMKLLICNMLAAFTVHSIGIMLLLSYYIYGLKLDFSDNFNYVILTCLTGSILGISFGGMISAILRKKEVLKGAITSAVIMLGCFLAGLMIVQMKYIIALKAPLIQYINPAHLITDAFYSLYYYDTLDRFRLNIVLMIGYTVIFSIITYLVTRRRQYASI